MSNELTILAYAGLWTMLTILFQVLAAMGQVGLVPLAGDREGLPPLIGLAGRLNRAQSNSVFALAMFAPAILLVQAQGASSASTLMAAQIFLIARIVYVALYATGAPWIRTLVWMCGFLATGYLYLMAI